MPRNKTLVYLKVDQYRKPIICEEISEHPKFKDFFLLIGIVKTKDLTTRMKIDTMTINKSEVSYFIKGQYEDKNGTSVSNDTEEDLWNWK